MVYTLNSHIYMIIDHSVFKFIRDNLTVHFCGATMGGTTDAVFEHFSGVASLIISTYKLIQNTYHLDTAASTERDWTV